MRVRRVVSIGVAAALASVGAVMVASSAGAATFTPSADPTPDGAAGSLRAAVLAATNPGGDEIDLVPGGTYTLTACQGSFSGLGQLSHGGSTNLIIRTPSGPAATIRQTCVGERVLQQGSGSLTLDNVIVTGGNLQQVLGNTGGGIDAQGGVTVMNSTLTGNSMSAINGQGGAINAAGVAVTHSTLDHNSVSANVATGGAISTLGAVTVTDSTVSNNTANGFVAAQAGAINAFSGVTVTRSTVSDNTAESDGNSIAGAFESGVGAATITDSTLSGNRAIVLAAFNGTSHAQGGVFRADRAATVTNSTLSGNSATAPDVALGGAIFAFGLGPHTGVTLTNSTVTDNTSHVGGGIWTDFSLITIYSTVVSNSAPTGANVDLNGSGTLTSFATVIALPQGVGANCADLAGTTSNGFNLEDDAAASCGFSTGTADVAPGSNPNLAGALANNGGPTQTLLPLSGSPLIDVVPASHCPDGAASITTDQRGLPRPDASSPACDIGAVEVQPPVPSTPTTAPNAATAVVITPRFTG